MAFEELGPFDVTMIAGAAFVDGDQYKAVNISAAKTVVLANAAGEHVFGVLQSGATDSGAACTVRVGGISKMRAAGALTVPNLLKTDAAGKFVAATAASTDTSDGGGATDALRGSYVCGEAITAAGADGDIFSGTLNLMGAVPTTAI